MTPSEKQHAHVEELPRTEMPPRKKRRDWRRAGLRLLYVLFCFEIGVFLVVFPWSRMWAASYLPSLSLAWHTVWNNAYFRGAISGVGIVNICIAVTELTSLRGGTRR